MKETFVVQLKKFLPILIASMFFAIPAYTSYSNLYTLSFTTISLIQIITLIVLNTYLYQKGEIDLAFLSPAITAVFGGIVGILLTLILFLLAIIMKFSISLEIVWIYLEYAFTSVSSVWQSYLLLFLLYTVLRKKFIPSFSRYKYHSQNPQNNVPKG